MSDDYKIQVNTNVNGDLVNVRASGGDDMLDVMQGFAKNSGEIFKALGDIKQAALVNGVFTGSAADAARPKAASGSTAPGETPSCPTHGPMKDMRGKRNKQGDPYKNRWYCKTFGCADSKGTGDWIE